MWTPVSAIHSIRRNPLLEITNLDEVYAIARVPEHQAG